MSPLKMTLLGLKHMYGLKNKKSEKNIYSAFRWCVICDSFITAS
jgi:hypothetical protein